MILLPSFPSLLLSFRFSLEIITSSSSFMLAGGNDLIINILQFNYFINYFNSMGVTVVSPFLVTICTRVPELRLQ